MRRRWTQRRWFSPSDGAAAQPYSPGAYAAPDPAVRFWTPKSGRKNRWNRGFQTSLSGPPRGRHSAYGRTTGPAAFRRPRARRLGGGLTDIGWR